MQDNNNEINKQIRELEAKYRTQIAQEKAQTNEDPKKDENHLEPYLEYLQKKYSVGFPADIQFQNQLLFAIFCELVEIKTANEEAREFIKQKGDVK